MANGDAIKFEVLEGPRPRKKWSPLARKKQKLRMIAVWAERRQAKARAQIRSEGSYADEPIVQGSSSSTMYLQLGYEDYKQLEGQMKAFKETTHVSTPGPFYHKSIRIRVNNGLVVEFHGPNVRGQ